MTSYDGNKSKSQGPSGSLVLAVVAAVVGLAMGLVVLLGMVLLVGVVVAAGLGFKSNRGGGEFRHLHYILS